MIEPDELIEKIIKELRGTQGELIIAKTMHNVTDDVNPKNIAEFVESMIEDIKSTNELNKIMNYNEGKFDAYVKMLSFLGFEYKL